MFNATKVFGIVANVPAHWHSEPKTRGTYSILSSYLITLTLCVWSIVHVTVVPGDAYGPLEVRPKSWWGRLRSHFNTFFLFLLPEGTWRKIGWLILAVLAPEIVSDAIILYTKMETHLF